MEVQNVYEEINEALQDFKKFLEEEVVDNISGPVIKILKAINDVLGGEVVSLFGLIDEVLEELRKKIDGLSDDVLSELPQEEIDTVLEMAEKIVGFAGAAKKVLESQSGTIDDIANITTNVVSVPKLLAQLKDDILDCITTIRGHLATIKDQL